MNPIIIALDCESAEAAWQIVDATSETVDVYKVGLELYAAAGIGFVNELLRRNKKVFLDLKLHDIGETVKRATARIAQSGVSLLTVHAEPQVMAAAMQGKSGTGLKILAVTVLTSLDQIDMHEMGYDKSLQEVFDTRARNAIRYGVDGMVCSPREVAQLRRAAGPDSVLVTPGVRSAGAAKGDQKRVATPAEAIADGATYLVIGRQVTRATDPNLEVRRIMAEIGYAPPFTSGLCV